ncbi:hypothetical protein FQN53_001283 [Emmonsiellopsis sp. PD_33]|nr:hypothetical protein FQN53_001283 [Emmonsiellopsis sp. PD_33]
MPHLDSSTTTTTSSTMTTTFTSLETATTTVLDEKAAVTLSTTIADPPPSTDTPANPDPQPLPYWLVNVPKAQWPTECPPFLQNLPPKSIQCLSTPDALHPRQDWGLVKELVASNQIYLLQRMPSDLRNYLEYISKIKAVYGSVLDFVVRKRLGWVGQLEARGKRPFECLDDIKILYNDWPYGVEKDIVHLVVWTKFELDEEPGTDDLTPEIFRAVDEFVERTFRSRMPGENVIWFKNWKSLKSVHAIEHFHVMLYKASPEFLHEVTNGDAPVQQI